MTNMRMQAIPSILPGVWSNAVELARDNAVTDFKDYFNSFNGNVPDERGLTDRFLLDLVRKKQVKMYIVSCTI